jgi:lipopolysaccharide heptosyltransferase II
MTHSVFIKLAGIGDLLMLTPAIRAYKTAFPEEEIFFVTGESNQGILKNNPYIDRLIPLDDFAFFSGSISEKFREAKKLISLIKESGARKIFVFHRDWRWNLLVFLAEVKERHGFSRDLRGLFLTHAIDTTSKEHQLHSFFKVLGMPVPSKKEGLHLDIFPTQEEEERINRVISAFPSGDIIAIAPGGAANTREQVPLKRWPLEHYRELIRRLLKHGFLIFLIGGKGDYVFTTPLTDAFSIGHEKRLFDLSGRYSLGETCAFLKKCLVMVTHDSGPMHIASAAGIPVIAIFGPTEPEETKPLTSGSYIFWRGDNLPCAPCYKHGKFPDCKNAACLNGVSPEEVYKKVIEVLKLCPS